MTDIPQKRFTKKRLLKWTGISILALAVIYFLTSFIADLRLKQKLSAAEKKGHIVTVEGIKKTLNKELLDHENAAFTISAAYNTLAGQKGYKNKSYFESQGKLRIKKRRGKFTPEGKQIYPKKERTQQEEQAYHELMTRPIVIETKQKLAEIKNKKGCDFKVKNILSVSYDSSGNYTGLRNSELIEFLYIIEWITDTHNVKPALPDEMIWNDIILSIYLLDQLTNDPRPLSQEIKVTQMCEIIKSMLERLKTSKPTEAQRQEILALLPNFKDPAPYLRLFECHLVTELETLKNQPYAMLYNYYRKFSQQKLKPFDTMTKFQLKAKLPIFKLELANLIDSMAYYHKEIKAFPETGSVTPFPYKKGTIIQKDLYASFASRFTKIYYPSLLELEKALAY